MNTNPAGNTLITNAEETTSDSNGEFERFEAVMSGLVQIPKKDVDKQRAASTSGR
jgi:hypothetical protein